MKAKWVEEYLDYLRRLKNRSVSTLRQYRSVLREFLCYPLSEEGFKDYLYKISSNSPKTQEMKLSVVKGYLRWLQRMGRVNGNFWEEAEPPRYKPLPKYMTREDLIRFFDAVNDPYYRAIFRFLVNSGLRISELLSLKESDVYISGNTARVHVKGKGSKERVIQMNADVVQELIEVGFFKKKVSARTIQRKMKEYLRKAGIDKDLTPHSLRHTFAIMLMERGIPLNRIQALLGHESISTTSVYLKITGEGDEIPRII